MSFHVASLTQLVLSLWFSGALCKRMYFIVPFDNSTQHSGIFFITELDYFQGNTLWITLTLSAHSILHRTNIYFFLHIHDGIKVGIFANYIFAKRVSTQCSCWHTGVMVRNFPDLQLVLEWPVSSKQALRVLSGAPKLLCLTFSASLGWKPIPMQQFFLSK